jgi:hypothetical protein
MISRRRLFSLLPLGALGAVVPAAKTEPQRLVHPITGYLMTIEEWRDKAMVYRLHVEDLLTKEEPSAWVAFTCQRPEIGPYPSCGQKFKSLRGAQPICPKCGALQYVEDRIKMAGIPC